MKTLTASKNNARLLDSHTSRTIISRMLLLAIGLAPVSVQAQTLTALPNEPIDIGTTPQFFIDDYLVDNRWAVKYGNASKELVLRVFHQPKKFEGNPVLAPYNELDPSKPRSGAGCVNVILEPQTGLFRMWYQSSTITSDARTSTGVGYRNVVGYAESKDGVHWTLPTLDVIELAGRPERNAVWAGMSGKNGSSPIIIDIPAEGRRGYRYVMLYLEGGIKLVGSHDGIRWDRASVTELASMHSDCANSIVYDPRIKEYVMFCRAKDRYIVTRGDIVDVGESRRVARMTSPELWRKWASEPQMIMIPDEIDAESSYTAFYGMPTQLYSGIYWGFLQPFKWNTDATCQLAFSRDGMAFQRDPRRRQLIELGPGNSWDSGMIFASSSWVEVKDEWWIYYSGWDGPHGMQERLKLGRWGAGNIGLAKLRKEGFVSLHGPENGGVIATRKLRWPGGKLFVNANASGGELKVRVSDEKRKVVPGFDYKDGAIFSGNDVKHEITWNDKSLDALKGQIIRLEFFLKKADLYSFRTTGDSQKATN